MIDETVVTRACPGKIRDERTSVVYLPVVRRRILTAPIEKPQEPFTLSFSAITGQGVRVEPVSCGAARYRCSRSKAGRRRPRVSTRDAVSHELLIDVVNWNDALANKFLQCGLWHIPRYVRRRKNAGELPHTPLNTSPAQVPT